MDESTVFSLIAEGENQRIDLKRELDITTGKGKSELVKDIISIANSSSVGGYILVGVDDSKLIVGIDSLEEERIQQVAQTYISPPVVLTCTLVPIESPSLLSVGVIEVQPTLRPHKVARSIDRLDSNDSFVRHGSVVARASPEEIIGMRDEAIGTSARYQYIRTGEIHFRYGNLGEAIDAFSKAIELEPTAESYLRRGSAYCERHLSCTEDDDWEEAAALALEDFAAVVMLAQSAELEKEARLARLRMCAEYAPNFAYDTWQEDVEWLRKYTDGRERGEVSYLEFKGIGCRSEIGLTDHVKPQASLLDDAIEQGYEDVKVFELRADHHLAHQNYGLALSDISAAIDAIEISSDLPGALVKRGRALLVLGRVEQAYEDFARAGKLSGGKLLMFSLGVPIEKYMLFRVAIAYQFGSCDSFSARSLAQLILALSSARERGGKAFVEKLYPQIAPVLREIVGEEFWQSDMDALNLN